MYLKRTAPPLTPTLKRTYDFIKSYHKEHGIAPTQAEIAQAVGLSYPTISGHIKRLVARGALGRIANKARGIFPVN